MQVKELSAEFARWIKDASNLEDLPRVSGAGVTRWASDSALGQALTRISVALAQLPHHAAAPITSEKISGIIADTAIALKVEPTLLAKALDPVPAFSEAAELENRAAILTGLLIAVRGGKIQQKSQ